MPVLLLQNDDGSGHILRDDRDDQAVIYDLRPEGAQILLNVYGFKMNGPVDSDTVEKLVGLRLASLRAVEVETKPEPVVETKPEPVVETKPEVAASPPIERKPRPERVEEARPNPQPRATPPGRGPLSRASREFERPSDVAAKHVPARSNPPTETRTITVRNQRRTRGREVALQVLYQVELNPSLPQAEVDRFLQRRLQEPRLCEFARALIAGIKAHREQIDGMITDVAENWRLDRMAAIDRNILRLGAYEMLFDEGVPVKVAINEALELAKRYSTAQSSRFVNGILDRLYTTETARKTPEATAAEPGVETEPESPPDEV
jgi:N utilization substance protein B